MAKTILIDAWQTFVVEGEGIFKAMYELLETFPNPKIILTNADNEELNKFGLDDMPYEVFTLKHNPDKANPEYYEIMLEHFGLGKEDVVYFEHSETAVKSAQSVGIKTYQYDSVKRDIGALKNFLTDNL
jgi:HAD superfamily hydrolase (TIGR01509 family)